MILKIISGKWKNTYIPIKNFKNLRPTNIIIKKKLFNWLYNIKFFENSLDLFAGSGSLGFEFASIFKSKVIMIEKNKNNFKFLINLKKKNNFNNVNILNLDSLFYISNFNNKKFQIVFMDPPYIKINKLINLIKLSLIYLKIGCYIYLESILNISVIYNYFINYLKLENYGVLGKINFFLFKILNNI